MNGGRALEIGCGRGVGIQIILDTFGASHVDVFDLDPRMVKAAERRHRHRADRVKVWQGDATHVSQADAHYDAVFDFGIIHHVPSWRQAISEVWRVLKPGGRFFGLYSAGFVIVYCLSGRARPAEAEPTAAADDPKAGCG